MPYYVLYILTFITSISVDSSNTVNTKTPYDFCVVYANDASGNFSPYAYILTLSSISGVNFPT